MAGIKKGSRKVEIVITEKGLKWKATMRLKAVIDGLACGERISEEAFDLKSVMRKLTDQIRQEVYWDGLPDVGKPESKSYSQFIGNE